MRHSESLPKNDALSDINSQLPVLPSEPLIFTSDKFLEEVPESKSIWYESEEEINAKVKQTMEKAKLLKWVQKQMERNLTRKEKAYIENYFFSGLTLQQISQKYKVNPSSVSRGIRRAIKKLRNLMENELVTLQRRKMKRVSKNKHKKS